MQNFKSSQKQNTTLIADKKQTALVGYKDYAYFEC
jgi:hypothetical protein